MILKPRSRRARVSLVPRPHPQMGKGLVTFERLLCQQNARDYIQYSTSNYAIYVPCGCHMTADTAQPRKRSNVFPICGWGLGTRLRRASIVYVYIHMYSTCTNVTTPLYVRTGRCRGSYVRTYVAYAHVITTL